MMHELALSLLDTEDLGDLKTIERLVRAWNYTTEDVQRSFLDECAQRAARGSDTALDLLLAVIDGHGLANPSIRRLVASDTAVDDVAQDVLIAVANSIESYSGASAFRTWLFGVARNQALLHIRRQNRGSELPVEVERPTARISSMIADRMVLSSALRSLPEVYREAVTLRDIEQRSYQQIADQLCVEINTVKSRISRGRALLAAGVDRFA